MGDFIIALAPLTIMGCLFYGWRSLVLISVSLLSSVIFEYLYRKLMGRSRSIGDLSAVITGLLIAYNLPASAPVWMPVVGSFFAIVIVKQVYGGIGKNIFNPAVAGIAFMTVTWRGVMSTIPMPYNHLPLFATPSDFEPGRTVLAALKAGIQPDSQKFEMMYGYTPGYLGTTCIIVILAAALYLLYRRIISWQIPLAFLGTVAAAAAIFPRCPTGRIDSVIYELTSGSLMFAAIYLANDPVTSPVTGRARFIYGFFCGLFTVILRYFGIFPEGAYFAILLMNPFAIALDRLTWKFRVKGGKMLYAKE